MSTGVELTTSWISVRQLVEFAARQGSLERRYTPSPTGTEGIEGHKAVTARRGASYKPELALETRWQTLGLRGRADGYDPERNCLEEIKTCFGKPELIADNQRSAHWAQAQCYAWMLCRSETKASISVALIYYQLLEQIEVREEREYSVEQLEQLVIPWLTAYADWQGQINKRIQARTAWVDKLTFPFAELHSSQRQMAEAVYKSAITGVPLLVEAPTGTGKTLGSIFPAIKALNYLGKSARPDKVFYLTAKSTTKQLALDALQLIASDSDSPLRVVELSARDKACLEPERECDGRSCPYAQDFFTKLIKARAAAAQIKLLNHLTLETLGRELEICPYYLAMEMARWTDLVIADVNYYFDGTALLLALTQEFNWKPLLLIDEAHNLVERGRMIYSADISRAQLQELKPLVPAALKKPLARVSRQWSAMVKSLALNAESSASEKLTPIQALPPKFLEALASYCEAYETYLQINADQPLSRHSEHQQLRDSYFKLSRFYKLALEVDEDYLVDIQPLGPHNQRLSLRCLLPGTRLGKSMSLAQSTGLFSATLQPLSYFQQLLGLAPQSVCMELSSPFTADQLRVQLVTHITTRYHQRQASLKNLCELILDQVKSDRGNALVFVSSYDYLQQLAAGLAPALDDSIELLVQQKGMSEAERQAFLARFQGQRNLLGLAVLGGVFGEGIDLPGEALRGVFIATLGLPQFNAYNEYLRGFMQARFGMGYEYAYLYPGILKVVQAAGRVIRRKEDRGYVYLVDDRFKRPEIRQLLPHWWNLADAQQ